VFIQRILHGALAAGVLGLVGSAATADMAERTVTNGDATIAYSVQGEGPLVVLIASTGRGPAEFEPLADQLVERGYRVALPEPRGVGGSSGPMEGATFQDFADDFARVIEAEGDEAIVAGHAYGNWIARTIASDHPGLTRGVVVLAGGAKSWPPELSDAITMINDPASTEDQRLAGLRLAFFAEGNDPRPWLEGWHPEVTASQRAARRITDQSSWWSAGGAPILDLQAGSDPFRPEESRMELKDEFGDRVTVTVIPGASHALPAEKPIETANAIADWADTLPE
jgi:pimeloyl-ACP methyl ester carboxylesterase